MDKLLQQFSITEISTKTHISPIILDKLKNRDFSKMTKIKAIGFIKILEEEYPGYDFSKIKEDIQSSFSNIDTIPIVKEEELQNDDNSKKLYLLFGVIVLIVILTIFGLYKIFNHNSTSETKLVVQKKVEKNITKIKPIQSPIIAPEVNVSEFNESNLIEKNNTIIQNDNNITNNNIEENNVSKIKNDEKITENHIKKVKFNSTLVIIPLKKVWFKVTYLDNFKSKEYLTSHKIDLKTNRPLFIKFGHGFIKLVYNNKIIKPNTKKVIRFIIKNNTLKITNKKVREYK